MRPKRNLVLSDTHLDRHAVRAGERVQPGDRLGLAGTTGNAEGTAPHLHFGIHVRGQRGLDPGPFVAFRRGRGAGGRG